MITELYNDDCFNVFSKIKSNSIHLCLTDIPYGVLALSYDIQLDIEKMFGNLDRVMEKYKDIKILSAIIPNDLIKKYYEKLAGKDI